MQPVREALPYSYQSWIVVYILQDSTGKINIFLPDLTIFLPPPALLYLPPAGRVPRPRARVTFGRSDLPAFLFDASGGPISSSSGRNGGKNAAKNQWFLEFLSSDCSCGAKRFRSESPLRLPSLPLTGHAESNGRPPVWAIIKSRTCRRLRQVWVRPAGRGNYNILDIRIGAGFCPALSALRLALNPRRGGVPTRRRKFGRPAHPSHGTQERQR